MEYASRGDLIVVQVLNGVAAGTVTRVRNGLAIGFRPFGAKRSVSIDVTATRNIVPAQDINISACRDAARSLNYYFANFDQARAAFKPHLR